MISGLTLTFFLTDYISYNAGSVQFKIHPEIICNNYVVDEKFER